MSELDDARQQFELTVAEVAERRLTPLATDVDREKYRFALRAAASAVATDELEKLRRSRPVSETVTLAVLANIRDVARELVNAGKATRGPVGLTAEQDVLACEQFALKYAAVLHSGLAAEQARDATPPGTRP